MEKLINVQATETELASIVSALDFALIEGTREQFTEDDDLLSSVYAALDARFPDDLHDNGLYDFTKTLASRLAAVFVKEDA